MIWHYYVLFCVYFYIKTIRRLSISKEWIVPARDWQINQNCTCPPGRYIHISGCPDVKIRLPFSVFCIRIMQILPKNNLSASGQVKLKSWLSRQDFWLFRAAGQMICRTLVPVLLWMEGRGKMENCPDMIYLAHSW